VYSAGISSRLRLLVVHHPVSTSTAKSKGMCGGSVMAVGPGESSHLLTGKEMEKFHLNLALFPMIVSGLLAILLNLGSPLF
jgi:hypothetical protein